VAKSGWKRGQHKTDIHIVNVVTDHQDRASNAAQVFPARRCAASPVEKPLDARADNE